MVSFERHVRRIDVMSATEPPRVVELRLFSGPTLFLLWLSAWRHTRPNFWPQILGPGCCLNFRQSLSRTTQKKPGAFSWLLWQRPKQENLRTFCNEQRILRGDDGCCCEDTSNDGNAEKPPQFLEKPRKMDQKKKFSARKKSAKFWLQPDRSGAGPSPSWTGLPPGRPSTQTASTGPGRAFFQDRGPTFF